MEIVLHQEMMQLFLPVAVVAQAVNTLLLMVDKVVVAWLSFVIELHQFQQQKQLVVLSVIMVEKLFIPLQVLALFIILLDLH
jgi:hypothetical protein